MACRNSHCAAFELRESKHIICYAHRVINHSLRGAAQRQFKLPQPQSGHYNMRRGSTD